MVCGDPNTVLHGTIVQILYKNNINNRNNMILVKVMILIVTTCTHKYKL